MGTSNDGYSKAEIREASSEIEEWAVRAALIAFAGSLALIIIEYFGWL